MRLVLVFLFVSMLLHAQFEYGDVVGTVRDASSAVVPGTKLTLRSVETNVERIETANDQGAYSFPSLRAGHYTVAAEHNGFRTAKTSELDLRTGDRLRVDIALETGQISEQVTVESATPLLETETSARGQVIQGAMIRELPLNQRDYTQLVLLVPGTTFNPAQRLGGAISVNGNRTLQNNYLLDGVDNNSNATSFRGERVDVIRPSVDALEEFKVLTNSYSAEYGRSAGAVINVTIKGGTNRLHGTLWEFFRNDAMDAHGWTPTIGGVKPNLRFNQFGGNIGGPIRRDKTFFFVNYEGERQGQGVTYQAIVPTLDLRAGDFSRIASSYPAAIKQIPVDPTTGLPFPGNLIPASRWSPVTRRLLADPNFPKPTPSPFNTVPSAYTNTVTNTTRSDKFDLRVDQYLGSQWRLFGRYSFSDLTLFRPAQFAGYAEGSFNDGFGATATRGQNAVIGNTVSLAPTTLLEVRAAYTRLGANVSPPNFGSPSSTKITGIPNLPGGPEINAGWPKFSISGLSALGSTTSTPQFQIPNVYIANATLSMTRGKQNIRIGFDEQYIQTAILDVSSLRGTFTFSQSNPATSPGLTGNAWADFLMGTPAAYTQTSFTKIYNRKQITSAFFQDDYRIARNLTLNLGVRYEYGTPVKEKFNHLANFSLQTGQLIQAKDGSAYDRALVNPQRLGFSPRIGLAWTPTGKMVIRSGYGIFYNLTNRQGREGLLGENPPYVHDLTHIIPGGGYPLTFETGPPADFFGSALTTDQILRANDPKLKDGYVQQFNLTVQYELANNLLFEAGYVGNKGTHLTRFWNGNQARLPGPGTTLQARRPFPAYADIEYMDSGGTSNYNAFQTRLERRFAQGISLLNSFTWNRGIDNAAAWNDANGSLTPQNAYDYNSERGLSANIVKLNSVTSFIYQLPFGRGRRYMSGPSLLTQNVLGGWELAGIWNWRTGLPATVASSTCTNCQLGGQRTQRGDVVAGVNPDLGNKSSNLWFNTAAFRPAAGPYGTAGRNTIYGPGLQNWDITAAKDFPIGEQRYVQFRADLFNLFNHVNYNPPDTNASSATFGTITSALPGRSIQLALKIYF